MADFCRQCTRDCLGLRGSTFEGLLSETDFQRGMLISVLCEGCGPTQVDVAGHCTHPKHHHMDVYEFEGEAKLHAYRLCLTCSKRLNYKQRHIDDPDYLGDFCDGGCWFNYWNPNPPAIE